MGGNLVVKANLGKDFRAAYREAMFNFLLQPRDIVAESQTFRQGYGQVYILKNCPQTHELSKSGSESDSANWHVIFHLNWQFLCHYKLNQVLPLLVPQEPKQSSKALWLLIVSSHCLRAHSVAWCWYLFSQALLCWEIFNNLRSMLIEFLMTDGNAEANYLRVLLKDLHSLFQLLIKTSMIQRCYTWCMVCIWQNTTRHYFTEHPRTWPSGPIFQVSRANRV